MLSTTDHDRDVVDLTYVYPVISRRAGGVSLGVNISPNNACNWQCVYCQVPDLTKGVSPRANIVQLKQELDGFLQQVLFGDFMVTQVPEGCRDLKDIAISGNGEPTTCPNFKAVVETIVALMCQYDLSIPLRLITNGSSVHKEGVQQGLKLMASCQGEVWFKVDAVGAERTRKLNGVTVLPEWQTKQLKVVSKLCAVKLQTCVLDMFCSDEGYVHDYLAWLQDVLQQDIPVAGVLMYSLARPSMQQGGDKLQPASLACMQDFTEKIESLGLSVTVSS